MDYTQNASNLEEMRKRLSENKLSSEDISMIDQILVGHIELHKSMATASERVGDKVVLAKLPFGVDLVK